MIDIIDAFVAQTLHFFFIDLYLVIASRLDFAQGLMEHPKEIADYFNRRGVSIIFLFRRNLLRRMVSVLANSYDRYAKLLNGAHKSHVHSTEEVSLSLPLYIYIYIYIAFPLISLT